MADKRQGWLEYTWDHERQFINQLGKTLKTVERDLPDRFHSKLSRLELLKKYLYVCKHVRWRWNKAVPKSMVLPYLLKAIEKEENLEREQEYLTLYQWD